MLPTRLTIWLLALGLVPLAAGAVDYFVRGPEASALTSWLLRLLVLGYDLALLFLLAVDAFLAGRALARLRLWRERPTRLSVGVENEVTVVVENFTAVRQHIVVRDLPPAPFPAAPALLTAVLPAHGWVRLPYRLVPTDRGNFAFGDLHVRCRGPLGLAWCDRTYSAAESVQVFPNLLEVRRYEALVRTTLVRVGGYHIKRIPGAGREFSHFRDYTVDDDYRFINWKATARRGKPITAVFESEHSQDVIFCLDVGRMMAARVGGLSKLDQAINAVLMLTHVSHRFQDNLGLLVFSHTIHLYLPPAKGRAQHARFLQALYTIKPELVYVNYKEAFQYLIAQHPKRALTMVFTDLLDTLVSAEYRDAVQLLRRFHLPLTLAVADVPLRELAARTPQTSEELYDIQVARSLLHDRAELLRSLERAGVMVVDTTPERLTVDAVNRYLSLKTGAKV
jgi:uncharacterized protein (DUF58 family)